MSDLFDLFAPYIPPTDLVYVDVESRIKKVFADNGALVMKNMTKPVELLSSLIDLPDGYEDAGVGATSFKIKRNGFEKEIADYIKQNEIKYFSFYMVLITKDVPPNIPELDNIRIDRDTMTLRCYTAKYFSQGGTLPSAVPLEDLKLGDLRHVDFRK